MPISIAEQIESTQEACETGAAIARGHVRDAEGRPTSDPKRFIRVRKGLARHCPGLIVQCSTGWRSGAGRERGGMLALRPDMASLTLGSNNFPTRVHDTCPSRVRQGRALEGRALPGATQRPLTPPVARAVL